MCHSCSTLPIFTETFFILSHVPYVQHTTNPCKSLSVSAFSYCMTSLFSFPSPSPTLSFYLYLLKTYLSDKTSFKFTSSDKVSLCSRVQAQVTRDLSSKTKHFFLSAAITLHFCYETTDD